MELLSDHNPLLKQIRRAVSRGGLTDDGFALAEGPHLIGEAQASGCEIGAVIVRQASWEHHIFSGARLVSNKVFREISSTETPQGVMALVRPPAWTLDQVMTELVVVLDGIQDPGNAGAILRAAEAFGASGAVFLTGTVNPYNPKCMRGSAGSVFRLPLMTGFEASELVTILDQRKLPLYAAMPDHGQLLRDAALGSACAIAIGSEGHGVSAALSARAKALRILTKNVESLNVAVAAGVILYEAQRQRGEA